LVVKSGYICDVGRGDDRSERRPGQRVKRVVPGSKEGLNGTFKEARWGDKKSEEVRGRKCLSTVFNKSGNVGGVV